MERENLMSRRVLMKTAGCGLGLAAAAATGAVAASPEDNKQLLKFDNAELYAADGTLDVDKAKKAILRLCEYHKYPVFPDLEKNLWVSDYGIGQFTSLGLAACIFFNSVEDRYMIMDLFILPGQMLPEHWHVAADGNPAKREGWLVRWGVSHIVGVGEPNLGSDVVVPKCHWGGKVTTKHEVVGKPGMFVPLAKVETPHWQLAGPEGAILTEVANVHTGGGVRHSDPVLNEYFLKSL
jgi:D-lyxose ketol-isomerase